MQRKSSKIFIKFIKVCVEKARKNQTFRGCSLFVRVERKCSRKRSPERLPDLSDVHFVAGTALNRIHHVFADTGILRLDRNVSSGSGNRGRYVGMCVGVASSPATGKRTGTVLISGHRAVKGAPDKGVAEVTITAIRT